MSLIDYGYGEFFRKAFDQRYQAPLVPARIIAQHKSAYIIKTDAGEVPASVSGKFRFALEDRRETPAVGDFAAVQLSEMGDRAVIHALLPRRTCFYRSDAWDASGVQVLGCNFDTVFLCMSLNQNFNLSRLERYRIMAEESRADVAVVLTKADLCRDAEIKAALCEAVAKAPVFTVSAVTGQGIDALRAFFARGRTVAALGSSGVGKSSLLNALAGCELMKTGGIREEDGRGHHTTVHRQILPLPSGGLYFDMPGLREIGLTHAEDAVSDLFEDVEHLMASCRFSDCRHGSEPGCAVRAALESGELAQERWRRYQQYLKEARYADDRKGYIRDRSAFFKTVAKHAKNKKKQGEM